MYCGVPSCIGWQGQACCARHVLQATALAGMMSTLGSRYTASLRLGVSTDTFDAAGRPVEAGPWQHVTGGIA